MSIQSLLYEGMLYVPRYACNKDNFEREEAQYGLKSAPVCLASHAPSHPNHPNLIPARPYDLTPQLELAVQGYLAGTLTSRTPLEPVRGSWWKTSHLARVSNVPTRFPHP